MKVRDLIEEYNLRANEGNKDLDIEIDISKYKSLNECCNDTINRIENDCIFADAEYNLFGKWKEQRGFSESDALYAVGCGYEGCWFLNEGNNNE